MNSLAGTGVLARLIVRRDRILLAIWIVCSCLPPIGVAAAFIRLYPTTAGLRGFADECMSNPTIVAMLGPILAPTVGAMTAWRTGVMGMLAAGIPSLLLIVRHTRAEEEAGRRELLSSAPVGRYAALTAALFVTLTGNLLLAALIATGLISLGLPAAGSIALGLSWATAGWIFAAVAAVAAQLASSASAANAIAQIVFGIFFVTRVVGDSRGEPSPIAWVSWLSPLGWTRLTRPFADERWWIFAMVAALVGVLTASACALSSRRDLGAGVLPSRPSPAVASAALRGPFALAWRLQRSMLIGWSISFGALGLLLGSVGQTLANVVNTPAANRWLLQMHANDPGHAFLRVIIYVLGQTAAAYAIAATMVLRSEEVGMRAEPVLAAAVSRLRWAASHLIFAVGGPTLVLTVSGFAIGISYGLAAGDPGRDLITMVATAIRTLPAVWVIGGVAMLLYGTLPRHANFVSWAVLAACLLLELGWEMRQLSLSIFDLSPFAYVHWAAGEISLAPVAGLTIVAAILMTAGLAALSRSDIG